MGLINVAQVNNDDELNPEFFNDRFGTIVDEFNGGIDNSNIEDLSITTGKIVNNAVTAAKIETQQAWQAVTYQNGWIDYDASWGGIQYYKDSLGIVRFRGLTKSGTTTAGTNMFTLPVGYRPGRQVLFVTMSNAAIARIDIHADGTVKTGTGVSNVWVTFAPISFRAEG